MHYFLYPTKDTFITNYPAYMYKNMGLDEILEVEKRISSYSCASSTTYIALFGYTSSSIELLSGSMSASYDSGSTDHSIVSSSYVEIPTGMSEGAVLSRALLQFNLTAISQSIANGGIQPISGSVIRYYLNLKVCESKEVPVQYRLTAYPVSQSWNMGTGYKYDGATVADGANWKFHDGQIRKWTSGSLSDCSGGGCWWLDSGSVATGSGYSEIPDLNLFNPYPDCPNSDFPNILTASYIVPPTGAYACHQDFDYSTSDVRMDVTTIVNAWTSGQIPNSGFIIMHSDETSSIDYGSLRFFSKETNTIYSPYLDICWEDATFATGSGTSSYDPLTGSGSFSGIVIRDAVVNMKNMAKEYKHGSIIRMDVVARKRYPVKTFTNKLSDYLTPYFLPADSFYTIKDAETNGDIIPYDIYTRLSFDAGGNYFMLDTSGLPQERYFKVEIRSEQSGSILTYTVPTTFKISR
jgi:hypothetical protein